MKKGIKRIIFALSIVWVHSLNAYTQKDTSGKIFGEVRSVYTGYDYKQGMQNYATALGGRLEYRSVELYGLSGGVAFSTSEDIRFMTGKSENNEHNNELSSSKGHYTQMSQTYMNYRYDDLNFRAGRQVIDTPLADSDDIRMIQNSFEAYIATYKKDGLTVMGGNLQRWQGYDAGLDDGWVAAGDKGTWFAGVEYGNDFADLSLWYYDISRLTRALYVESKVRYAFNENILMISGIQFLNENELEASGIQAQIYGVMAEVVIHDLSLYAAYNKSEQKKSKESFSGFGGGTLYTNMDTMILNDISKDRDASSFVVSLGYLLGICNIVYGYGSFEGKQDSSGSKVDVREQDGGLEYSFEDNLSLSVIYVLQEEKQKMIETSHNWQRVQICMRYRF